MKNAVFSFVFMALAVPLQSWAGSRVEALEDRILATASRYTGQGDPDRSIQRELERLVADLLEEAPQPSVRDRLPLLYGAWKQVWGPYAYRRNDRGVDPRLDVDQIYQVVFSGGYYYNVNPQLKGGRPTKIVLLRGEFKLDDADVNSLSVRFTNLRSAPLELPTGLELIDLPALSESRRLPGEKTTLPSFLVRAFFGGGTLREVYTSPRLRLTFGTGSDGSVNDSLYVLERVK